MYRLIQSSMSLVIFMLAGCSPSSNLISQTATSSSLPATLAPTPTKSPTPTVTLPQIPTQTDSDLLIIMERGACYGKCPVYKLTIDARGYVSYEGIWNVKVEGVRKAWINSRNIQELVTAIVNADFFSFEDRYAVGVTDLDSVTLSITLDGQSKSIWHYGVFCNDVYGDAPPELCELENLIDEITNSSQWVGQVDIFNLDN